MENEETVTTVSVEQPTASTATVAGNDSLSSTGLSVVRCEVCNTAEAKYKCPRCMKRTCSVPCVKRHKEQEACSGARNKAAYVAMEDFTESHLVNDIHFLEDGERQASSLRRSFRKIRTAWTERLIVLLTHAHQKGVFLKLMPNTFSRHKENTSMYHYKSKLIKWHVDWIFPVEGLTFKDNDFSEEEPIQSGVEHKVDEHLRRSVHSRTCTYLKTVSLGQVSQEDKTEENANMCPACSKMSLYLEKGFRQYHVFLRVHGLQSNRERYYELDKVCQLKECLQQKLVIEFPSLYIVPDSYDSQFITLTAAEEKELQEKQCSMGFHRQKPRRWRHFSNRRGHKRFAHHSP